jgi:PmbA protein
MAPNKEYEGIAHGPFTYVDVPKTYDHAIPELDEELVDIVREAMASAIRSGAERTAGVLYATTMEESLVTSNDVDAQDRGTWIELSLRAFTGKDASGHATCSARTLGEFDPVSVGERAGELSKLSRHPKKVGAGRYDVVFDPLAIAALLSDTMGFASAFAVESGLSFLAGKLGKRVANHEITLVDDGRMEGGFGSRKFDAEGVPTQRTPIIDHGILGTYLHNTSTAIRHKTQTTGNAGLISPQPWNGILMPGDSKKEELFDIAHGIYITNVWYTRYQNYYTGDFSTIPRDGAFLIEHGELGQAVKNIRISDNLQRLFEHVRATSKERRWIHWWEVNVPILAPYVLVKAVKLTKSSK